MAVEVAKMLGIYKRGVWFPVNARIVEIEEDEVGTTRITMRAGQGIYIIARALSSVRIKVSENELESIMRRVDAKRDEKVRSAVSMLPVILIILGIALALAILLQRG